MKYYTFRLIVSLIVISLFVCSVGCDKKVPSVGADIDTTSSSNTRVDSDRKKSDNQDPPVESSDVTADHTHIAISYEIDRDYHRYTCGECNKKVEALHAFRQGSDTCDYCQAKKYVYVSGYTIIKMYDGYGNVTVEQFYDPEGNMAYNKSYMYDYLDGRIIKRTDYQNKVKISTHLYTYNYDGSVTETVQDVDGTVISETVN